MPTEDGESHVPKQICPGCGARNIAVEGGHVEAVGVTLDQSAGQCKVASVHGLHPIKLWYQRESACYFAFLSATVLSECISIGFALGISLVFKIIDRILADQGQFGGVQDYFSGF